MGVEDDTIAKFYARNPGIDPATKTEPEDSSTSPLDIGSLTPEDVFGRLSIQTIGEVDFIEELMPALRTRLVWDIVPDDKIPGWSKHLMITPGSEEGNVVEQAEADRRRQALGHMAAILGVACAHAGDILTRAKLLNSGSYDLPGDTLVIDEDEDYPRGIAAGASAVIAEMLDLGVLKYGKAVTGE